VAERGETLMRTFIDANILIAAATGRDALFDRAWAMLDDPERVFFTSEFVRLEVMPKGIVNLLKITPRRLSLEKI
jgi:predicted nucleic acid-binding protein